MKHEDLHPGRKSHRLQGYDYSSAGAYFLTIVTQDSVNRFGSISNGVLDLNEVGEMIQATWDSTIGSLSWLAAIESIVMPNHLHGIVLIKTWQAADAESGEHKIRPSLPSCYYQHTISARLG